MEKPAQFCVETNSQWQFGERDLVFDRTCLLLGNLRLQQVADDTRRFVLTLDARTDLFLQERDRTKHADLLDEAIARAKAYATAGASGFFVPGLIDDALIAKLCKAVALPVNVLMMGEVPALRRLAELGVARVSYGPGPYRAMIAKLKDDAATTFASASQSLLRRQ